VLIRSRCSDRNGQVAGLGDFFGADTSDMMLRDSTTGFFQVYDVSNNSITGVVGLGTVGLDWQLGGFGDFSGNANETDMILRNSTTAALEVYDISNNAITNATGMGAVGLDWAVGGFGDFSGNANETDMIMRNNNTAALEVYDISNMRAELRNLIAESGDQLLLCPLPHVWCADGIDRPVIRLSVRDQSSDAHDRVVDVLRAGQPQDVPRNLSLKRGTIVVLRVGDVDRK
jgi:hypothetical protein